MKEVAIGKHLYSCITEIGWVMQQRFRDVTVEHFKKKFPVKKKKGIRHQESFDYEKYQKWIAENYQTMEFQLLCLDIIFEPKDGAPSISSYLQKNMLPPEEDEIVWGAIHHFFLNVRDKMKPLPTSANASTRTRGSRKRA